MSRQIPKISIVTPSLNQGDYLEKTILSILNQNYPNLEYVIIDGGSKDSSPQIIKRYENKLAFWISEKDEGQYEAINKGFEKTTGGIMTWLNSDDVLMPGTLDLVANIFQELPEVQWVTGIPTVIGQDDLIVHRGYKPTFVRKFIELGFYHGALLGFIMQEGTFWRRELWEKVGGRVGNLYYGLDYQLWRKFARHSDLTSVYASLAAFRLNPTRKTKEIEKYYQDIGINFPKILKSLSIPFRLFVHYVLRFSRISPKIFYNSQDNRWYYSGSGWKDFRFFSRKKIVGP